VEEERFCIGLVLNKCKTFLARFVWISSARKKGPLFSRVLGSMLVVYFGLIALFQSTDLGSRRSLGNTAIANPGQREHVDQHEMAQTV
jgi:hypothetical protein